MISKYMMSSSSASPFAIDDQDHDYQQHHPFFVPNYQSSSSLSCHVFFNPTQDQAPAGYNHPLPQQEDHENHVIDPDREKGNNYKKSTMKLSQWKNGSAQSDDRDEEENPVKWMSSKMGLMQKMKNNASADGSSKLEIISTSSTAAAASSSPETDHFSSSNSFSYNVTTPIRVCADCNTTKTPLWRSGPKGPKSLCNACGIRQRKARRAMAAAVANGTSVASDHHHHQQPTAASLKIMKVQNKEKTQFKKRCKLMSRAAAGESSSHNPRNAGGKKKGRFEDFLFDLSKNLAAFHRVFPQDEKEAAILLMALSCGLVHG